ncbi:hypothetical protein IEQ34_019948 [Dendrobium chrysotoxum]|uniref:Uncharacterized protein n=1 Tax=Dendrobium chrysotoxum TaxID=161865 RepID=A0AAV7G9Z2_DENCH|nr:hypothetical protein IEQ34_019948 [Dendrobium chrysotoxum]
MGLIALFRDRGVVLTLKCLSRLGRFTSDAQGWVTFRFKWLDISTRDPLKSWACVFFFIKNDWSLIEKWGKLKDLPTPLHVGEEDIMRILKVPDNEHLLYKVCYLSKYIKEEFLFKVGLSFYAGRSDVKMLRKSSRVLELPIPILKKSIAFKTIIQDHVQEARDHIYDVEVKALEQQCIDEGFIWGFLKGDPLVQQKTGVTVEGLTPSQASSDPTSDSDSDEIKSEL